MAQISNHQYTLASGDLALAKACAAGEADARHRLFREYSPLLRSFFAKKASWDSVGDLINDTFLRLFERCLRTYTGEGRLRSFILGVAYRCLLEHYRKGARIRYYGDSSHFELSDHSPSPTKIVGQQTRGQMFCTALQALPADAQTLLELHYWNQYTTGELAEHLGRPVGTIRSQLGRARELLQQRLESVGFDASEWLEVSAARGIDCMR